MSTVAPLTERLEFSADLLAVEYDDAGELASLIMEARDALVAIRQHYELRSELYSNDADLAAAGYDFTVPELVAERAAQARDIGVDGLVCSAEEAGNLKAIISNGMVLVTPGIRPADSEKGDQKRVMTPRQALDNGASILVIGRPITRAEDPDAAARAIAATL